MPTTPTPPLEPAAHLETGALSYEEARDELVRVVGELERGAATLEQSLALWERGEALAARCEEWLIGAKTRLDAARASAGADAGGTGGAAGAAAGSGAPGSGAPRARGAE